MKENIQWTEQLKHSSHIGILVVDKERNNLFVNPRLCEMFGYTQEFLLANTAEIFHVNHTTFLNFAELAFNAVLNGTPLGVDYQFKREDGSLFWIHISGDPIKSNNEVLWTMVDITTRVESEKEQVRLKERLELALLGNNDGVWDLNLLDNSVYYSPRWKEMLGYKDDEIENTVAIWEKLVHPDDRDAVWSGLQKHIDKKIDYYEGTHRLKHKDGSWIWILDRGKAIYDESGNATRMIGTHTDITAEKALQLKFEQQAQMIEQTHDSVISTDLNGIITSANHGTTNLLDYSADELIGQHVSMIYFQEDYLSLEKNIETLMREGESHSEVRLVKKSGDFIDADLSLSTIRDEKGEPTGMVGYSQDITKRKKAQDELKEQKNILDHQAHHDFLTGLPNRILFADRLEQALEKAKRDSSKLALLFIDLDHFKEINDSLGHAVGDEILKIVTARLKEVTRDKDTVARLGGDEFTIILEDLNDVQDTSLVASKILRVLADPIEVNNNTLYVSSSIGISIFPDDGESSSNLLKFADSAMYKAKDEGRNNYQYYNSKMTELAFERVVMEASLRAALKEEQFVVYYQPQVNGKTDTLVGMEALVRWQHPNIGLVSPDKFIPLAESTGLIVELDRLVMKTAMTQLAKWYEKGLNPGILAMNLAVKQLQQKDFIETFKNLMQETHCKPEWLELEVTEGQIMSKPQEAIEILNKISDMGIELAVDDFGTGYSSLAYLKRLPINKLKIDRAFVRDLPDDEEDAGITRAVIALAKSLNLRVIAEGVETQAQRDFIVENGCETIQGYFYSRPVTADEIEVILKNGLLKKDTNV